VYQSSTSVYNPNIAKIGKTFCGWTDVRTNIETTRSRLKKVQYEGLQSVAKNLDLIYDKQNLEKNYQFIPMKSEGN